MGLDNEAPVCATGCGHWGLKDSVVVVPPPEGDRGAGLLTVLMGAFVFITVDHGLLLAIAAGRVNC